MTARRGPLGRRIALFGIGVAVITALVAGGLSIGLIVAAETSSARSTLARVADATSTAADLGAVQTGTTRARRTLQALGVDYATIGSGGRITAASSPLARAALTRADIDRLLTGQKVSATRSAAGSSVLVEGRPVRDGAIVLVQRRSAALAAVGRVVRRILLALLIGVGVAALLGLLVARRLTGPLRRTAAAAHALAAGRRDVVLEPDGPAEVAAVATAVNTLAANLADSESRQRHFLTSVSHELRTPLTAIAGYAESLAGGVVAAPDTARVGAALSAEAARLDRLVADLLDLARLDAVDFRLDVVEVDVAALAADAASVWAARCAAVGVAFRPEFTSPEALPSVRTDPMRLRQAVDALLENALRITAPGAPIVLALRAEPGPRPVTIEVRDGGPGLTADDFAVAFEQGALYERYRGVRKVGTGLGLAIVHRLVTRLGGTVEAGPAVEGGARFTIRLPATS